VADHSLKYEYTKEKLFHDHCYTVGQWPLKNSKEPKVEKETYTYSMVVGPFSSARSFGILT
jgi:hypothetical protein